jgi:hypothetical protein
MTSYILEQRISDMDAQTLLLLAILGGLLLICALIAAGFLIKRTVSVTVAGFSWYRKVFLEHYIWVSDSSYDGFPEGSRNRTKQTESYQSYEFLRTETRTTTINDQTTTTSEPVYGFVTRWRTKYTYEIQQWQPSRTIVAEGEERAGVYWPSYVLDTSTYERVKDQKEQYLIIFQTPKGKQYKREMNEAAWRDFDDSDVYTLKVNLFGQIKRVEFSPEQLVEIQ